MNLLWNAHAPLQMTVISKHHTPKVYRDRRGGVPMTTESALDRGEWSASHSRQTEVLLPTG
jgi:hypothetical protein